MSFEKYKNLLPKAECVRWLSFILALAKALDITCEKLNLSFEFSGHTLKIEGAKEFCYGKRRDKKDRKT